MRFLVHQTHDQVNFDENTPSDYEMIHDFLPFTSDCVVDCIDDSTGKVPTATRHNPESDIDVIRLSIVVSHNPDKRDCGCCYLAFV